MPPPTRNDDGRQITCVVLCPLLAEHAPNCRCLQSMRPTAAARQRRRYIPSYTMSPDPFEQGSWLSKRLNAVIRQVQEGLGVLG